MIWKTASNLALLVLVLAVPLTALLGLRSMQYIDATTAYHAAPMCASAGDVSGCRYQGVARVVKKYLDKYSHHWVDLTFDELNGRAASGIVPDSLVSAWGGWKAGDPVDAEMWDGNVTRINGVLMDSSPDSLKAGYTPAALIFAAVTVLLLVFAVATRVAASRSARPRTGLDDVPPATPWR